jgi:hypothetical protein
MLSRSVTAPPFGRGGKRYACAAVLLVMFVAGCKPTTCDRSAEGNPPIRYVEGSVENGVYMSSDWDGSDASDRDGLLYFPGGMRYEIEHKLGEAPRWWQLYVSFVPDGVKTGTLSQAAGNQAEVNDVSETTLTVVNGSCSDYWLLVVAGAGD